MNLITIDTNIVRDLVEDHRPGHTDAEKLFALHETGKISIAVTTRVDFDVPNGPLRSLIFELEEVTPRKQFGTAFRVDVSRLDMGDMIVGERYQEKEQALLDLLFPNSDPHNPKHQNRIADIDHLLGHQLNSRDAFITNEKGILARQKELLEKFGIQVISPAQLLARIT